MPLDPTIHERVAAAERDMLGAVSFAERRDAAAALSALNAEKLSSAFAERDDDAAASLNRALSAETAPVTLVANTIA
jgi:hypothetical protein